MINLYKLVAVFVKIYNFQSQQASFFNYSFFLLKTIDSLWHVHVVGDIALFRIWIYSYIQIIGSALLTIEKLKYIIVLRSSHETTG